jgi:hypothetical protein
VTAPRLAIGLGALLAGVLILRAPTMGVGSLAERMGAAREESAYVLGVEPVRFALPSGARELRLLVNFDRREPPATAATAETAETAETANDVFEARVRVSPDGRDETFALVARDDGVAAAGSFYLDSARRPARTAAIGLERDRIDEGVLEVALVAPRGATGVGRVLALQKRALGTAEPAWASLPADGGAHRRRIYFAPVAGDPPSGSEADSASAFEGGVWLAPGRASAWTLTGPATVRLSLAEGSLRGKAFLLTAGGAGSERDLALAPGAAASFTLGAGLTTVRLLSSAAARVVLTAATVAPADGGLARALPLADGRFELQARPTIIEAARTEPATHEGEGDVTFALAGRGAQPLRIDVRGLPRDGDDRLPLDVSWRLRGSAGQVLARGARAVPVQAAPEDAVVGATSWLGEPASFFVWPPAGATTLEIGTARAAEITAASPAWVDVRAGSLEDDGGEEADAAVVRLRHGPTPHRRSFFGIAPANRATLLAEGRLDRLALAPRLERAPVPVRVAAQSLTPVGRIPRVEMLVPDSSTVRLPTQVWALAAGRDTILASGGGGASVLYTVDAADVGGSLAINWDGHVVSAERLFARRGQVSFATPAGAHTLRVDAPPSTRLFVNQPIPRASTFRRVALYELASGGSTHFRVDKGPEGYVVGVMLYGRSAAGESIVFEVDGGARPRLGPVSSDRTTLRRALPVTNGSVRAPVLLNTDVAPTWVSKPLFVRLGDDLAPGRHDLAIRVVGARGPTFARVFGHVDERGAAARAHGPLAWDLGT